MNRRKFLGLLGLGGLGALAPKLPLPEQIQPKAPASTSAYCMDLSNDGRGFDNKLES